MSAKEHLVYTDGSCKAGALGQRPGGWGYVVVPPSGAALEGYGSARDTEAKVMEYMAVAEALATLPVGATARVFADDQTMVELLQKKLRDHSANGFSGVDRAIVDSVRSIDASIVDRRLVVTFVWVRSHNGNARNERADALAAQGAREAKADLAASRPKRR